MSLRLEPVEDRTLASAAPLELPPPVLSPTESGGQAHSRPAEKSPTDHHASDSTGDTPTTQAGDLIVDASQLGVFGFEIPAVSSEDSRVLQVRDQRLTPEPAPGFQSPGREFVPSDAPASLDIERVKSPADELAPPDKPPPRRATESPDAAPPAGDTGRTSPGTTAAAPTAERARDSASAASGKPALASAGDRVADPTATGARRAGSPVDRSAPGDSTQPGSKSDGAAPAGRVGRPADAVVPRADAGRLHSQLPDGSLLHRFVVNREEAAFAALVQRHERLVLGVCQRVLGDWHAAQDALQATFLVLARKAGMLDRQVPLTNWLYTVAYHAALRLRAVTARNRLTEAAAAEDWPAQREGEVDAEIERLEIQQAVREELQNLPAEYREPLALCYVDGLTHRDAAREIGIPRGSIAKRLGEGLERLRERLVVRGVST